MVQESLATAEQVKQQDMQESLAGTPQVREGVAKDRRKSREDAQMRHGRKSRSVRVEGDIRPCAARLGYGLGAGGEPDGSQCPRSQRHRAEEARIWRVNRSCFRELHIDRAYLSRLWVQERPAALQVYWGSVDHGSKKGG